MNIKRNIQGYSLVELLVVIAIVGLMGVGTMTMMGAMMTMNRKVSTQEALSSLKNRFVTLLTNQESWRETIYGALNNGTLACLRANREEANFCAAGPVNGITVYNRGLLDLDTCRTAGPGNAGTQEQDAVCLDGTPFFNDAIIGNGFTIDGETCNTWTAAGNDLCPYTYNITITFSCQTGQLQCRRPQITAALDMVFSPSTDASIGNRIDEDRFDATIDLTERVTFESFRVAHFSGAGTAVGGGDCAPGGWRARPFTDRIFDVGDNLMAVNANSFQVRAGVYKCDVSVEAHGADDGVAFRLVNTTAGDTVNLGSGRSSNDATVVVTGTANMEHTQNFTVQLQQFCVSSDGNGEDYGKAKSDTTGSAGVGMQPNTFATVTCTRLN